MSLLYVIEDGAQIGIDGGVIKVIHKDKSITKVPKETVETINIYGNSQMSTQCIQFCLRRGISVTFFSKTGSYFGRLVSTGHINVKRQKKQVFLSEEERFPIELSRKIIDAKINNQIVLAKRYLRNSNLDEKEAIFQMQNAKWKLSNANSIEQIMGYEGIASKYYFQILSDIVVDDFKFEGRNRRPPKDPFNSMLSFGYTILLYELYGEIESRGLNPYVGFLHQDRENHPTLASDMMEEWRAIIVDAVVMSLTQGHEISSHDFYFDEETGGCILDKDGMKIFLNKLENKFHSETKYVQGIEGRMSFRHAIWHQIGFLVRAIENEDVDLYQPIKIR